MTDKDFKDRILQLQPYMQKVAEKLLGNADKASDAVQEAVIGLWSKRQNLDTSSDMKSLCITVVKRRCIDVIRKQQPTVPIDEASLSFTDVSSDELMEERYQLARHLVDQLPERQRKIVLMKYEDGMSNDEIEKALGMSSTHVYATLSRAYKSLRTVFENYKNEK